MRSRVTRLGYRQCSRRSRRQLLDAAAFGKHLRPEQLENMAGKPAEGLRAYTEAMAASQPPADGRACLDFRNRSRGG
ncbi:DUF6374 family protein [Nocardia abscessus]|uniref:DUF6374 family protein n=1 Tax=Nocardia abscessus TaxID=120957 RepID=UPI003A5CCBBF